MSLYIIVLKIETAIHIMNGDIKFAFITSNKQQKFVYEQKIHRLEKNLM